MRTLIDDVFDDLIIDLKKWHTDYHSEEDVEEGLEELEGLLDNYSDMASSELRNLQQDKSWYEVDRAYEEGRLGEIE